MMRTFGIAVGILLAMAGSLAAASEPADSSLGSDEALTRTYEGLLESLRADIGKALPSIDEELRTSFTTAYSKEAEAWVANLAALRACRKPKKGEDPGSEYEAAKKALARAREQAKPLSRAVLKKLAPFLAGDELDGKLAKCVVLTEATPAGLATFAQQGPEQEALVNSLLNDERLMKQMLLGGGAQVERHVRPIKGFRLSEKDPKKGVAPYGRVMEIYTAIQKSSAKAGEGVLQRLALAVSLEHAVPVGQRNPQDRPDAPATVDPVRRYLHYEKAFLKGELDAGFEDLGVWECRNVVNGDEPDESIAWGRQMLENYRPDHIATADYRWRYVKIVKTDVQYIRGAPKMDWPFLHRYENIIAHGGICGRRAFFGRFILRSFGIPTVRRPQSGHGALAHWTPDGWVVCLGADWPWGWTDYGEGLDFVAHTQARSDSQGFLASQRARWVGDILGERRAFGFHNGPSGFWNGVALYRQQASIEAAQAKVLEAVGTDISEANESKVKDAAERAPLTAVDRTIVFGKDGVITIPAAACSNKTNSTQKIVFMKSNIGGMQLHYNRLGEPEDFQYEVDLPDRGLYTLRARVVTTSPGQHLLVSVNNAAKPIDIAVPFTIGRWGQTEPVQLPLREGRNVLQFSRGGEKIKGVTIRDFTLTPVE